MAYEVFKKKVEAPGKKKKQVPLKVKMDSVGRLVLNQAFYDIMMTKDFRKVLILIDYEHNKIALKMMQDTDISFGEYNPRNAKTLTRGKRHKVSFVSFVTVKNALDLKFPFTRNATWDAKENLIEFSWKEDL